jgi:hypothetical protein
MRKWGTYVLLLLACTPATDLQSEQGLVPTESNSGQLTNPETDFLTGQLIEPPPGSVAIPINLAGLTVQFTEEVWPTGVVAPFLLRPAAGEAMPLPLGEAATCMGTCYRLVPGALLVPSAVHTLEVVVGGLQFFDGKPVPGGSLGTFSTTAAADTFLPRLETFTAATSEGCLSIKLVADEAVHLEIILTFDGSQTMVSPDGLAKTIDYSGRLPDPQPTGPAEVVARVVDRAGNATVSAPVSLLFPPRLPRLVITEVLANPAGSENTQEMVEIYNAGNEPVELAGLRLADKAGSDVLPAATLAVGAFAVVVAEAYNPSDGKDPAPREGTLVVRVPGRLGNDGLSNSGEVVQLLTNTGDVISQYGGWVDVSATSWSGKSVKRSNFEVCDAADAWGKSPATPTPGW